MGLKIFENWPLTRYCPPDGEAKFKLMGGEPKQNSLTNGKLILADVSTFIIKEST